MTFRQTVVLFTKHATFAALYERHLEHFGVRVLTMSTVAEMTRHALELRSALILCDETSIDDIALSIAHLRQQPLFHKTLMIVLCRHATPEKMNALHRAGSSDIILTIDHTPRAIVARIQTLLAL